MSTSNQMPARQLGLFFDVDSKLFNLSAECRYSGKWTKTGHKTMGTAQGGQSTTWSGCLQASK